MNIYENIKEHGLLKAKARRMDDAFRILADTQRFELFVIDRKTGKALSISSDDVPPACVSFFQAQLCVARDNALRDAESKMNRIRDDIKSMDEPPYSERQQGVRPDITYTPLAPMNVKPTHEILLKHDIQTASGYTCLEGGWADAIKALKHGYIMTDYGDFVSEEDIEEVREL